jgi:hypothetical protein
MRQPLPIANGFYVSDSLPISAQRVVNWYPSVPQTSTITDANLFGTTGISSVFAGGNLEFCRGAHNFNGTAYFVISNNLIRLNSDLSTEIVGIIPGLSRVSMSDNRTAGQMCIVAPPDSLTAGVSYIFTESPDTLTEITDPEFDGPASAVDFSEGYFIFQKADSNKGFNSPINNGLTGYDAADFFVIDSEIESIAVLSDRLYVFGNNKITQFGNVARVPAPFAPVRGATIDVGSIGDNTTIKFGSSLYFIGSGENEGPAIWLVSGNQKQKISTKAIERELLEAEVERNSAQIYSWAYSEKGSYFVGFSLPETCFVYDITNGRWHERQSLSGSTLGQYRVTHAIKTYDKIFVGDSQTGNIGQLSSDIYLEYDKSILRSVTSRPFDNLGNSLKVYSIEVVMDTGQALSNEININGGNVGGFEPRISLSWSDDGGRTFTGVLPASLGKTGQYKTRPTWTKLGSFYRDRVIKFEMSSPTKSTLIKVEADIG